MAMRSLKYLILAVPLALTACGDGWEMTRTEQFPYGNIRTAGTGVAYVRAKMLPEKQLNVEPAGPQQPEQMHEIFREKQIDKTPDTDKKMDEVFREKQTKG